MFTESRIEWIVYWFVALLLSTPYFLWQYHYKYITPSAFGIQTRETNWPAETPFPAITICNLNKVKKSFESLYNKDELRKFFIMDKCFDGNQLGYVPKKETRNEASQWKNYYNFENQASQSCSEMIRYCRWDRKILDCKNWFKPVVTNKGMCCEFNIAHQVIDSGKGWATEDWPIEKYSNWTPEYQFKKSDSLDLIPKHTISNSTPNDFIWVLRLGLHANIDEYLCSENRSIGFEVMIHNPVEIPPFDKENSFNAYTEKLTQVRVWPQKLEPTTELLDLDLEDRSCYLLNEIKLRFYRIYTKKNCELECLANYTIEFCGCLPKYIPVDFNIKICGKSEEKCVANMPTDHIKKHCGCSRACFEVNYSWDVEYKKADSPGTCPCHLQNMASLNFAYHNLPQDKVIIKPNEEYVRWMYYANISYEFFIAFIRIFIIKIILKIIHYYWPDFYPSFLSYF